MGRSSSSPQVQTTTSEPPGYVQPHLNAALGDAASLYASGRGAPVVPFSGDTETALNRATQRALYGSPVSSAAQDYTTKTLQGGFMGSNPWLDQTFNKASGAVTNQIQSNFGLSGRNARGIDAAGFAQEGYNDLAAQIYGGDYQAERGRQQQLVPFATGLANQDYADIGQLANVGAQREALASQYANQPSANLDAYLARIGGMPGSMVTNAIPMERNRLSGALGGALAGNQMFGGWGALGGGILGGLYG